MFMCDVMPRIGDDVVQRDQAMLYFPQRCTALSKRCQTLASVAKPLSNVFQRCRNTWQFAAST